MIELKTQKGITLVALIITIVVLLILAGVAIGTVRDSDIIEYAKNASNSYEQARNNEISEIQSAEDLLEQYASQKNPWQQKGLTVPVEYGKKYTGSVAPGLGLSSLTITLGANGELSVEEAGINSTCNDSNITSITSNTITYNDDGDEIRIEYSVDGQSAEVFYNNNKLGTITVEKSTNKSIEFYSIQNATSSSSPVFKLDYENGKWQFYGTENNVFKLALEFDGEYNKTTSQVTFKNPDDTEYTIDAGATSFTISGGRTSPAFYVKDNILYYTDNGGIMIHGLFYQVTDENVISQVESLIENLEE